MKNCCFINNNFRRVAPVIVYDGHPVEASNNYGTFDDDLVCEFVGEFPNNAALEFLANYTCIDFDVDECQANLHLPTGPPVSTPAPVAATDPPTAAPVGSGAKSSALWAFAAVTVVVASSCALL